MMNASSSLVLSAFCMGDMSSSVSPPTPKSRTQQGQTLEQLQGSRDHHSDSVEEGSLPGCLFSSHI